MFARTRALLRGRRPASPSIRAAGLPALLLGLGCLAPGAAQEAPQEGPGTEPLRAWNLLDNGDFEDEPWAGAAALGTTLPWWRSAGGGPGYQLQDGELRLAPGAQLQQPCWYWPPSTAAGGAGFVLRGRAAGSGELRFVDSRGSASFPIGSADLAAGAFELDLDAVEARLGRPLEARFGLTLVGGAAEADAARFDDLELWVDLPDPELDAFALEIAGKIDWIVDLWCERGLDRLGERATHFPSQSFDVVTGAPLGSFPGGIGALQESLLELHDLPAAERLVPELQARWRAELDAFVSELLELSLHPDNGLPQLYDPLADRSRPESPIEASRYLRFLIDLARHGPDAHRSAARAAALRMGETVLAAGVVPTGEVAGRYRASTGLGDTALPSIRKLDMPTELVRLTQLSGDERFLEAALGALSEFEFLHIWGGTWDSIDPGLDDFYGHFGNRSVAMGRARPELPILLRLASSGLDYYGPRWRRTLAHGAFVAADQVRGWEGFVGLAELVPERRPEVGELIGMAVGAHLKGELDPGGRWVDVSHNLWVPRFGLEVGDVPGVPGNLLAGLALAHTLADLEGAVDPDAPGHLDQRFLRGAFLAVLRSTEAEYGRPFGYLPSRSEAVGANPSGAELRLLPTLVLLLGQL